LATVGFVVDLSQGDLTHLALVGGKNASLGEMIGALTTEGVRVPGGFAVTTAAFRLHMEEAFITESIHGVRHAATAARWAQRPALAAERQQAVTAAGVTMHAEKTSSEDATIEIRTDLAFNEASNGCSLLARVREKNLEVLPNDFVKKRLLRLVALVLCHSNPARDRVK
jgi:phosphoenolpyruvate synthase/pyruvate phosphate dikinase